MDSNIKITKPWRKSIEYTSLSHGSFVHWCGNKPSKCNFRRSLAVALLWMNTLEKAPGREYALYDMFYKDAHQNYNTLQLMESKKTFQEKERQCPNSVIYIAASIISTSLTTLHCFGDLLQNWYLTTYLFYSIWGKMTEFGN